MTKVQVEDLMREWSLYGPSQQKEIFEEFKVNGGDVTSEKDFHNFLRKKLNTESYWKKVGLI